MTPFKATPQLDPWLGPWQLEAPGGGPLAQGWYEAGRHHAVVFDWPALGEVGEAFFRGRFSKKVFGAMLDGKGKAVVPSSGTRADAPGIVPVALVSKEPVPTPFDHAANPAILFVSADAPLASRVLLVQYDALNPIAFVVADTLGSLGLTRPKPAPAKSEAAKERGNASFQAGELDQAIENYREAILLDWTNVRAINNYGRAAEARGDADTAAGLFRVAIRAAPGQLLPMLSLITLLLNLEQHEEARWWAAQAKTLGTKSPDEAKLLKELLAALE